MSRCLKVIAFSCCLATPTVLDAQTPASAQVITARYLAVGESNLSEYAKLYSSGDFEALGNVLRKHLAPLKPELDLDSHYTSVAFAVTPATQKDPIVVRVVLPPSTKAMGEPPHGLPGVDEVFEVVLLSDEESTAGIAWISTQQVNPKEAQVIKLFETVMAPSTLLLDNLLWVSPMKPKPDTVSTDPTKPRTDTLLYGIVRKVSLPHKRATIQVATRISEAGMTADDLAKKTQSLDTLLRRGVARLSPCALVIASHLRESLSHLPAGRISVATRKLLPQAVGATVDRYLDRDSKCDTTSLDPAKARIQSDAVTEVYSKYSALVSAAPAEPVSGTTEIKNMPFERWSLGLNAGPMLIKNGDVNHEVADKVISEKELVGVFTAAVLHFHFKSYDPTAFSPTFWERPSLMFGMALTPAPGGTVGLSFEIIRGLGIQLSHAWMLVKKPKPHFAVGDAATSASAALRTGWMNAWVIGASYNLK